MFVGDGMGMPFANPLRLVLVRNSPSSTNHVSVAVEFETLILLAPKGPTLFDP